MSVLLIVYLSIFFFSSRRRHTRYWRDWSSDVCSSDLKTSISDYMVVTCGRSNRHVGAVADRVLEDLEQAGVPDLRVEGRSEERRVGKECRSRWSAYQ